MILICILDSPDSLHTLEQHNLHRIPSHIPASFRGVVGASAELISAGSISGKDIACRYPKGIGRISGSPRRRITIILWRQLMSKRVQTIFSYLMSESEINLPRDKPAPANQLPIMLDISLSSSEHVAQLDQGVGSLQIIVSRE